VSNPLPNRNAEKDRLSAIIEQKILQVLPVARTDKANSVNPPIQFHRRSLPTRPPIEDF